MKSLLNNKIIWFMVIFINIIFLPLFSSLCLGKKTELVITTWCGDPFSNSNNTGYLDQILKEGFGRMDIKVTIERKPAERSLHDANIGKADGDFLRVKKIGELYPNLLIVPEHLFDMKFVAFSKKKNLIIDKGWKNLQPYRVGIIRGWKILEENVMYTKGRRSDTSRQELLFTMLSRGRIDVAIFSRDFGLEVIDQLGFKGINIVEQPFAIEKMHLFLHKKHKDKVKTISGIFKNMKKEGFFARIRKRTLIRKHENNQHEEQLLLGQ